MRTGHWEDSRRLCNIHNKEQRLGVEEEHKNLGVTATYKILKIREKNEHCETISLASL